MVIRLIIFGLVMAIVGCGAEPERSRVVPASEKARAAGEPGRAVESHRIETH